MKESFSYSLEIGNLKKPCSRLTGKQRETVYSSKVTDSMVVIRDPGPMYQKNGVTRHFPGHFLWHTDRDEGGFQQLLETPRDLSGSPRHHLHLVTKQGCTA